MLFFLNLSLFSFSNTRPIAFNFGCAGNEKSLLMPSDYVRSMSLIATVYFVPMLDVFISRFKYINHISPGKDLIHKMLSSGSILTDKEILNQKRYINLVCNLVESNIHLGINFLKNILNSWSNKDLNQFIEGRNELLWLLEKLAFREKYFEEAALLLLRLAETHPIRPSYENFVHPLNDANDYFAKIFSPVWGETPPDKKYEFLIRIELFKA